MQPMADGGDDDDDMYVSPDDTAHGTLFHLYPTCMGFNVVSAEDDVLAPPHLVAASRDLSPRPFPVPGSGNASPQDTEEVEQMLAQSSQSYSDLDDYADLPSSAWEQVDVGLQNLCDANKQDLTLFRPHHSRAGTMMWRNGYKTYLPWIDSNDPQAPNARADASPFLYYFLNMLIEHLQDASFVTTMAQLPFLAQSNTQGFAKLTCGDESSVTFAKTISTSYLAYSSCVLVQSPLFNAIAWTLEDFRAKLGLHSVGVVKIESGYLSCLFPSRLSCYRQSTAAGIFTSTRSRSFCSAPIPIIGRLPTTLSKILGCKSSQSKWCMRMVIPRLTPCRIVTLTMGITLHGVADYPERNSSNDRRQLSGNTLGSGCSQRLISREEGWKIPQLLFKGNPFFLRFA